MQMPTQSHDRHSWSCIIGGQLAIDPLIVVLQELMRTQVARARMAFKLLCSCGSPAETTKFTIRLWVSHLLIGDCAQKFAHPKASGVSGSLPSGQDVVCTYTLL